MCNHTFEWRIDHHIRGKSSRGCPVDDYDVMPVLPTFTDVDYDPYKAVDDVMRLISPTDDEGNDAAPPGGRTTGNLSDVVKCLIDSIVDDQREKVKLLSKSSRSSIILDMVANIPEPDEIFYLVRRRFPASDITSPEEIGAPTNDNNLITPFLHVVVEFPLLHLDTLSVPELEYLVRFVASSCPEPITLVMSSSDVSMSNSFAHKPELVFPRNHLPNLRHIVLPNWDSSNTLYDYLPAIEQRIADTWGERKRFVSELQQVAAVVEFDPVDFSFVSLSMRLTRNKHFILSIVDLRIPSQFPTAPILLLVHDLLSGSSYPLENKSTISSPSFFSSSWSAERKAREFFLALCEEIESMAFGGGGGSEGDQSSKKVAAY